ncbi:hypothetical protein ACRAWD_01010 [Caulobacter segnis]
MTGIPAGTTWYWGGASPTRRRLQPRRPARPPRAACRSPAPQSYAENSLYAAQFDAERFVKLGPIKSIQGGVRLERTSYTSSGYRVYAYGLQTQNITSAMVKQAPYVDDFFGGKGGNYTSNWQVIDLDAFLSAIKPATEYSASGGGLSPTAPQHSLPGRQLRPAQLHQRRRHRSGLPRPWPGTTPSSCGHRVRGNFGARYEKTDNAVGAGPEDSRRPTPSAPRTCTLGSITRTACDFPAVGDFRGRRDRRPRSCAAPTAKPKSVPAPAASLSPVTKTGD